MTVLPKGGQSGRFWAGKTRLKWKKLKPQVFLETKKRFWLLARVASISGESFVLIWIEFWVVFVIQEVELITGYWLFYGLCRYRHLMLNVVSLLPHCKKDNKVEAKSSKGATLNELVELKSCSSCLFFEVMVFKFCFECLLLICYIFKCQIMMRIEFCQLETFMKITLCIIICGMETSSSNYRTDV